MAEFLIHRDPYQSPKLSDIKILMKITVKKLGP